ncbi:MAG: hypothetical protein ISS47_00380 [Candidatus Omnitrophica bacterium]|nr:hypothetical protein [Candidatus Omnitrophota bacterium]
MRLKLNFYNSIKKAFYENTITLTQVLIMFIIGLTSILFSFFGNELVTYAGGLGWDGRLYGKIAKDFYNIVFVNGITSYHFHRILPSAIIYHIFSLFKIHKETINIVMGFEIYNLIIILISVYVWGLIADELRISTKGKWLGFIGLYINFAILKWIFYIPVTTDATAFVLSIFLIYYFLKNQPIGMLIVMILGNFTWPIFMEMGLILLMFPRLKQAIIPASNKKSIIPNIAFSLIFLFGIIVVLFLTKHVFDGLPIIGPVLQNSTIIGSLLQGSPVVESVLPLSIFLAVLFIYYATKGILDSCYIPSLGSIKIKNLKYLIIGIISLVLIKAINFMLSSRYGAEAGYAFFSQFGIIISKLMYSGMRKPFIFGIAHVVFFGPVLLLTFLFWKRFCRTLNEYGPGFPLFIFVSLILSINSESRQLFSLFPVFAIFTVKALDQFEWKPSFYVFIGFISLLYSKIWLVINSVPAPDSNLSEESYLLFPWQKLFMNIGHFMSDKMYIVQGSAILLTGIVFYFLFVHRIEN